MVSKILRRLIEFKYFYFEKNTRREHFPAKTEDGSYIVPLFIQISLLNNVLIAHVSYIIHGIMYSLELNGVMEEEDKLDSVCLRFDAGLFDAGRSCISNN